MCKDLLFLFWYRAEFQNGYLLIDLLTDLLTNLSGDLTGYFNVWPKSSGEESVNCKFRFGAFMFLCILYHAPDSCPRLP